MSGAEVNTVFGLVEYAEATPDKPALVVDGREVTYRSLLIGAAAVARLLRVNSVAPGERVLYSSRDKLGFVAAFLGITGSGRLAVPVPDGAAPTTVQEMFADSEASVMIVADNETPPSGVAALRLSDLGVSPQPESDEYTRSLAEFADSRPDGGAPALLLFTSGTTSKKKGVVLNHGNLMSATRHINEVMGIDGTIREYVAIPLHHSFGLGRLRCVLQVGGTVVLDNGMFDPAKLLHGVSQYRVNALSSVPAGFALIMSRMGCLEPQLADVGEAIRVVEIGSAAMPSAHKEKLLELLPNARLFMHYGLTEASRTTFIELRRDRDHWNTVGRSAPGVTVSIVDEHGDKVGPHQEGEIVVQGEHVMAGYFRDPARTRRAFCKHGFRTGDFGFLDDRGLLHLRGRRDDMINYGGVKISPHEIEIKLQAVMSDIEFAVVGVRDPADVAGKVPVIAYVPKGKQLTLEWLRERCLGIVDKYELPRALVPVDEIPRTENGKVIRRVLEERIDPAMLNQELVTMWQRILGVANVGTLDSFLDLGGDSLQAAMLANELQERLGRVVDVSTLFDTPTVAEFAEQLEKMIPGETSPVSDRAGDLSIPRREGTGPAPVSLAQQRLWFVEQWMPGNAAYQMPEVLLVDGPLDVAALRQSFAELARRHESLRTTFGVVDVDPVQIVADGVDVEFKQERLDGQVDRETAAKRLLYEELDRPFDLERGPLFRVRLLEAADQWYALVYNAHHIIFDAWSRDLLWRELSVLYEAFRAGRPSPLPQLPIQYSDFAVWQRQRLQGEVLESQLTYWRRQLDGLETLQLVPAHPRPATQSFSGAVESLVLSDRMTRAIRMLCTEQQVTVFMLMLAVFKTLLHRHTGQDDIVVGSPAAGRNRKQVEGLIGFFVNMFVLRTDLSGDPSGRELISRVRKVVLGAMRHQEVPFEKLVEELEPERSQAHNPLFQVTFLHRRRQEPEMQLKEVRLGRVEVDPPTTRFDLEARVVEDPTGITLELNYSTDLYDSATIRRMLSHFQMLLDGILADADAPVSSLPLLEPAERAQLLDDWNDTSTPYPCDACIHELFEAQAAETPNAIAVEFAGETLTYDALNRRANQVAHHLIGLGVGPEVKVGIAVERSVEMVVGILGVLKAGGAYVPLDPGYPAERLSFMMRDTKAPVVLTLSRYEPELPEHDGTVLRLDADWPVFAAEPETNPVVAGTTATSLAYVMYTSGSTGRPKGVCVPHRAISRLVLETDYVSLGSSDRMAHVSNVSFDAATFEIWGALLNGGTLVAVERDVALAPDRLAAALRDQRISVIFITTALFNQLAEVDGIFASIRCVLFGGEAVDPARVRAVLAHGAPERLLHVYGPTENTTFSTWHEVRDVAADATTVPIGRPIANTTAYVLDAGMNPAPIGVPGELYLGDDGLAHGYLNRPRFTAERFVPDPFSGIAGNRLYRTGDLVRYRAGGDLEFLGRVDHQVKLRGYRIELGEIETALLQQTGVRDAVVLCREDTPGDKRLVAYVTAEDDAVPSPAEFRSRLGERLPDYMIPSAFVRLDELPLTVNGKVDRAVLPAPDGSHLSCAPYVAPSTETERLVAAIWGDVLRQDRVGIHDNFFDLGGHSLLATQVVSRMRDAFGLEVPLSRFFDQPTVVGLADYVDLLCDTSAAGVCAADALAGDGEQGEL